MSESDEERIGAAPLDLLEVVSESGRELWGRVLGEVEDVGESDVPGSTLERWLPVVRAVKTLLGDVVEFGRYAFAASQSGEALPAELVEMLRDGTIEIVESFPNLADVYVDVDRLDAVLGERLDRPGVDDALLRYLTWLREFVDAVVRRMIELAFEDEARKLSPERAEAFVQRLDELLRAVLDRWLVPSSLEPTPEWREGTPTSDEPSTEEKDGSTTR